MKIYQSIQGVMNDVGVIGKDRKNQQQGFMYRGVEQVMNALQPAFIRHNIFVVPEVIEQTREERTTKNGGQLLYSILKVKFTFYADDGSNISATVIGEGMDSADKASNKAMSVAFKYACFQVFCIPTEEMVDPDSENPPPSRKPTKQAYDNSPPQSDSHTPEPPKSDSMRRKQIAYLIKGTKYTVETADKLAAKYYNVATIDDLTQSQFNDLYDRFEQTIKEGKGDGNG